MSQGEEVSLDHLQRRIRTFAQSNTIKDLQAVTSNDDATKLSILIRTSSDTVLQFLTNHPDASPTTRILMGAYASALEQIKPDVRYWTARDAGRRMRRGIVSIIGGGSPDSLRTCRERLEAAYAQLSLGSDTTTPNDALPASSAPPPPLTPNPPVSAAETSSPLASHSSTANRASSVPSPPQTSKPDRKKKALEVAENVCWAASTAAEFIPDPFGKAVKAIASTGSKVVAALKNSDANLEDAQTLCDRIADLVKQIQSALTGLSERGDARVSTADRDLLTGLGEFQSKLDSVLERITALKRQGRWERTLKHTLNKEEISGYEKEINNSFASLELCLGLSTVQALGEIKSTVSAQEHRRLLDLLGGTDNGATSKADRPEDLICLEGTRTTVLREISEWIYESDGKPILWINGVAGCGKTAIAATVAQRQSEAGSTVAIFHFNRTGQDRNATVVRALARMLMHSKALPLTLADAILAGVRELEESPSDYISLQLEKLVITPLSSMEPIERPIIIIFDALDEWSDEGKAAALCEALRTERQGAIWSNVKFVVTSRRESCLQKVLNSPVGIAVHSLALDLTSTDEVNIDIRAFLGVTLGKVQVLHGLPDSWPGTDVVRRLTEQAQGLFQWATTICKYVAEGDPEDNLEAVLRLSHDAAHQLDEVYRLVIRRFVKLSETNVKLLGLVLGCLVVAPSPMSLNTLAFIEGDDKDPMERNVRRLKNSVLSHLGALLVVPQDDNEPVRFLHSSIVDFLGDPSRCMESGLTIDLEGHHARIAVRCLSIMIRDLRLHIPEKTLCSDVEEARHRALELTPAPLRYVARHWPEYVLYLKVDSARIVQYDLGTFLGDFAQRMILAWVEAMTCMQEADIAASYAFLLERWLTEVNLAGGLARASLQSQAASTISIPDIASLFRETQQLIAACHGALSDFSFNVYHTLRTCLPVDSRLHSLYSESLPDLLKVIRGPEIRNWSPCIWSVAQGSAIASIALSKDGGHVILGGESGLIRVWSTVTRKEVGVPVNLEAGEVRGVAFGSGGTIIAATGEGVVIWRMETREKEVLQGSEGIEWRLEDHTAIVYSVAFSPDDTLIASESNDKTIRLWDVPTATHRVKPLRGQGDDVTSLAFSPDGKTLISGSYDDTIRLWIAETGECKWSIQAHSFPVRSVAFSRDGSTIASGSNDETVRLWDAETGQSKGEPFSGHLGSVTSVVFTLNDRSVISGSFDGIIRMWDISGTRHPIAQPLEGHSSDVTGVAFSPHGKSIVTGSRDRTLRQWDTETGEPAGNRVAEEHGPRVTCVAFSRDGRRMISGGDNGTLRIRHPLTLIARGGSIKAHPNRVTDITFSPDSTTFVSTSYDGTICRWDARTCRRIGKPLSDQPGYIMSADFATSGRHFLSFRFATGVFLPGQRTIYLHDAASGARLGNPIVPRGHQLTCRAIFSSDDTAVISDTGYAWDVQGILDGTCSDAVLVPGLEVVIATMRSDATVPLWIDERGWINLGGKPFLWLSSDYGRHTECWWRKGIIVIAEPRVLILDARNVPFC